MKKTLKYTLLAIVTLVSLVVLAVGYIFFWPSKYQVGDCLQNGEKIYLFDSDGPLLKGRYGLEQLYPKDAKYPEITMPKEMVESESWSKVDCPLEQK